MQIFRCSFSSLLEHDIRDIRQASVPAEPAPDSAGGAGGRGRASHLHHGHQGEGAGGGDAANHDHVQVAGSVGRFTPVEPVVNHLKRYNVKLGFEIPKLINFFSSFAGEGFNMRV